MNIDGIEVSYMCSIRICNKTRICFNFKAVFLAIDLYRYSKYHISGNTVNIDGIEVSYVLYSNM